MRSDIKSGVQAKHESLDQLALATGNLLRDSQDLEHGRYDA
jgi:hypothetical protein